MKKISFVFITIMLGQISGCASVSEGVTTAYLNQQTKEDVRRCQVVGNAFSGLQGSFKQQKKTLKLLMVHGVGHHEPGYSTGFQEKVAAELGLTQVSRRSKQIKIFEQDNPEKASAIMRVRQLLNADKTRELLFYELTWSGITQQEKRKLAYDTSGEYAFRRADLNQLLKQFSNDTSPDPMIYLSASKEKMLFAFRSAFCLMAGNQWQNLPHSHRGECVVSQAMLSNMQRDDYAIVSHSLGSRIVIDGMHSIAKRIKIRLQQNKSPRVLQFIKRFKQKEIPFYLMSNQLPLLEMGSVAPKIVNQHAQYCQPEGEHYQQRMLKKMSIIAFSDPNDLLSYAIPESFAKNNLDSRLCAEITNININIAHVVDLFGMGGFANPLVAHTGYDSDARVVGLIAKGIGFDKSSDIVKQRCTLTNLVD